MIIPYRRLIAPVLVLILLSQTACPSQKDLTAMAKASNELSHDVVLIEKTVAAFYKASRISKPRKDSYADKLKSVAVKGKAFNDLLVKLDKQYPEGTLPPDQAQVVRDLWQPLSLLIASVVGDLFADGIDSGKLNAHAAKIDEVIK